MPKFKTLNNQIPGLIRHCSPIRNDTRKGVAVLDRGKVVLHERCPGGVLRGLHECEYSPDESAWTLDLRDLTGAFHAAQYIQEHFDALEKHGVGSAHDFETVLGGDPKASGVYYGAYVGAGQGDPLTTPERKALAKIVLWVAERVN